MKNPPKNEPKPDIPLPDSNADTWDLHETAHVLKCAPQTLLELAECGEVPGCKIGVQWVFLREAIKRYLWMQTEAQQAERRIKSGLEEKIAQGICHETRKKRRSTKETLRLFGSSPETPG